MSIKDFLDQIKFEGKTIDSSKLEFFKISTSKGDCVRFNGGSGSLKTVTSPSDYLDFRINTLISSDSENVYYEMSPGIIDVYLDKNNLNSYLDIIPLKLNMNAQYDIDVARTESESQLPFPHNNCTIKLDKTYLQQNCIESCIANHVQKMYNCTFPSFLTRQESNFCENKNPTLFNDIKVEFYSTCKTSCLKECEGTRFSSQVVNARVLEANVTIFKISVSDFSTLVITQIAQTSSISLISDIGGLLGISLGLSFLSFVEIFELFLHFLFIILS